MRMKKTSIDWCPYIPEHWGEKRIKDIAFLQSGNSITALDLHDDASYPVYGGNGIRGFTDTYTNEGDYVLIGRQGALCGNINYAHGKFFATEHAVVVYTKKGEITRWLGETLNIANLNRLSMTAAQPGLAVSTINNQFIPYPPLNERKRIAEYLNDKTGKIDARVSLLSKKRDAYRRLKKALISRVVTKGLNPNTKFKPSGVDWIGEIPEGWEVKRIKEICDFVSRGTTPDYVDESKYKVMNQATFSKGYIDDSIVRYTCKPSADANIKKGDLLIASTGGGVLGKVLYYNREDKSFYADSHVSILRNFKGENCMKFLYYVFSTKFAEINATMVKGSTNQTELQRNYLLAHEIPIPAMEEQQSIASYLDEKCSEIDANIANLEKQIEKYKELKRALISEVVTGKRMV
ncbi:MAG: restriction endonuclease subunit S [Prevotella sp.]|nr:restriction endonuclease subunit S [Prevotella sp.]